MLIKFSRIFSVAALIACLVLSWWHFKGVIETSSFKQWFLVLSIVYFAAAVFSVRKSSKT